MRTASIYSDFRLHVEWRWPEQAGNSGVFLNISGPDQQWPATIEFKNIYLELLTVNQ